MNADANGLAHALAIDLSQYMLSRIELGGMGMVKFISAHLYSESKTAHNIVDFYMRSVEENQLCSAGGSELRLMISQSGLASRNTSREHYLSPRYVLILVRRGSHDLYNPVPAG